MADVKSAEVPESERQPKMKATRTLDFSCKCGCDLFRLEVDCYADGSWGTVLLCAACGTCCKPSEPITNGPH